jgi:predicted transposase YdaD
MRANQEIIEEALKMSDAADIIFEEILRKVGFIQRWEARGEAIGEARGVAIGEAKGIAIGEVRGEAIGEARGKEEKAREIAKNLLAGGFSVEQTAQLAGLDIEQVRTLT